MRAFGTAAFDARIIAAAASRADQKHLGYRAQRTDVAICAGCSRETDLERLQTTPISAQIFGQPRRALGQRGAGGKGYHSGKHALTLGASQPSGAGKQGVATMRRACATGRRSRLRQSAGGTSISAFCCAACIDTR